MNVCGVQIGYNRMNRDGTFDKATIDLAGLRPGGWNMTRGFALADPIGAIDDYVRRQFTARHSIT